MQCSRVSSVQCPVLPVCILASPPSVPPLLPSQLYLGVGLSEPVQETGQLGVSLNFIMETPRLDKCRKLPMLSYTVFLTKNYLVMILTASSPRPIQSIIRNVRMSGCMLCHPATQESSQERLKPNLESR